MSLLSMSILPLSWTVYISFIIPVPVVILKKKTFRFCSLLYQTLLSAMTEYKAILGRGKIGKQVGPTHLLKSNKLWCHPVGHKSYLKVYLAD